ncbi:hypothetical protein NL676_036317 [Syzygium grande]|nr:hypothetical protein NL676_036317 [Syzygium grande]
MCALSTGNEPLVIARGGFSGIFPDSSEFAVDMAMTSSMGDVVLYCDLQLTKDGLGICQPDVRLDNTTNIAMVFPKGEKTYNVNGQDLKGWFAVDYTSDELFNNVSCRSKSSCSIDVIFKNKSYQQRTMN